jgi:hypothetical protein
MLFRTNSDVRLRVFVLIGAPVWILTIPSDSAPRFRAKTPTIRRLKGAKLRYPACLEDTDFRTARGLDRQVVLSLGTCSWIQEHHNLVLTGPTGLSTQCTVTRQSLLSYW